MDVSMSPQNAARLTISFRARTRSRQMLIAFPSVNIKRVCCRDLFSFVPRAATSAFSRGGNANRFSSWLLAAGQLLQLGEANKIPQPPLPRLAASLTDD